MKRYTPYFQEVPGIYVYSLITVHSDPYRTDKILSRYHGSFDSFIKLINWRDVDGFGYKVSDRICYDPKDSCYTCFPVRCHTPNCQDPHHFKLGTSVVCDENGLLITPDVIWGALHEYESTQKPRRFYNTWRNGWWRSHHRSPKTTNERKQYDACMVDEDAPNVRGKRRPSNLPNTWDDLMRHNDGCWKTQSKRKHQWKNNK